MSQENDFTKLPMDLQALLIFFGSPVHNCQQSDLTTSYPHSFLLFLLFFLGGGGGGGWEGGRSLGTRLI